MNNKTKILLIYTGGTIGMRLDQETQTLKPFDFEALYKEIPELFKFDFQIDYYSFDELIDSSNITPKSWIQIAEVIEESYQMYDGFVILHGSDTMAYSASALSFIFKNLSKPIIFTGSQLPIGTIRTDGKENLITAIEIAAAKNNKGVALVPEVAIYFEYNLIRGNRSTKHNAEHFDAFKSFNYPILAQAGVHIEYNKKFIQKPCNEKLICHKTFDNSVAVISMYPGIAKQIFDGVINIKGLKGLVLETYGSGNATTAKWFTEVLKKAISKDVIILNITQCPAGYVDQGKYETSSIFNEIGVISGKDMTKEAAVTKLMYLLGTYSSVEEIKLYLQKDLRGELTP